ncbi:MAG TPA: nucleotide exchange factor GrpE [Nitrosopumilus sp.]|nr:nucleotide exchange factor GrpE [Thermoproteota archaeon]HJJ22616.1 nucleotide exchange factor GrpE [Nitrosopumilus sp.]
MSTENNSDEIPVNVVSENEPESNDFLEDLKPAEISVEELSKLLESEKQKTSEYEEKLKHVLADFQNLNRKTQSDIENGVNTKVDEFVLDFLKIYDDFIRAKEVFSENKINTDGLDSILKNMDSLLKKYHVVPIDALGEIFDPNFHEAISIITDSDLDDNTITKEIRKGYISHARVIRPTLVEISKKDDDKI